MIGWAEEQTKRFKQANDMCASENMEVFHNALSATVKAFGRFLWAGVFAFCHNRGGLRRAKLLFKY